MSHDEDEPHRSPHVPPGRCAGHGRGPERWPPAWRRRTPPRKTAGAPQAEARQDRRRDHDARDGDRGPARARSPRPPAPALLRQRRPHLRHRQGSTAPSPASRSGSSRPPRSASRSSWSPRTSPTRPDEMLAMLDERLAALATDYVDLFFIHGLGDDHSLDEAIELRQEPGVQGDGRRDPQVGQGEVHRLLDPPPRPRPDHPGGGRGRDRRRDHAPVHPLARQGLPAQQGARRLPGARGSA